MVKRLEMNRINHGSVSSMTNKVLKHKRVLVVDHDTTTSVMVGDALTQAGFEPTLAATGEQGLRVLREWPQRIDWLYTRAELPGLVDGRVLADEFHQVHPYRPVLYRTPPHTRQKTNQEIVLEPPLSAGSVVE